MASHFTSLTEHQQLVFWAELAVMVAVARSLGALCRRWSLPAVVGELAAGVLLGPSLFGKVWPGGFGWLFPVDKVQSGALNAIGWLGVGVLLLLTGFETDLTIVRRLGRAAGSVATGALMVPILCGLAIGNVLPATFMGPKAHRGVFALFMAVALGISSLPVIAKILSDLGLMRRDFGQVTVAVSVVNDLVGWLGLGVVAGLAESGSFSTGRLLVTLGSMVVLLGGGLTLGQRATDWVLRAVRARTTPVDVHLAAPSDATRMDPVIGALTATLVITLAVATGAQAVGIEAVLGAYVAGIVLGRSRFQHRDVPRFLQGITSAVLAPVFFATAGLKLDLGAVAHLGVLSWVAVILVVAVGTKFIGAYVGARLGRLERKDALALGAALNARGAVEVVIASIGLSLGVLGSSAYTAVVLMAILTSVMAAPLLRRIVSGWEGTGEEQERLEQERLLDTNLLVRPGRILLPSRGRPNSIVAAQVMQYAFPPEVGVTVLSVSADGKDPNLDALATVLEGRDFEIRQAPGPDPLEAIVEEAKLGYQVIGVGVSDGHDARTLSPMVEHLLDRSPVPLVVVRRAPGEMRATPAAFARALVPVTGGPSSRVAQEIAFGLSRQLGTEVVLTHVVNRPQAQSGAAAAVLDHAAALGERFDATSRTLTREGTSTGEEILAAARDADADLIVLGATVRRVSGRPFLGHNAEYILDEAPVTVVVVTTPDVIPDADVD